MFVKFEAGVLCVLILILYICFIIIFYYIYF